METLKKQIIEKLEADGFKLDTTADSNEYWSKSKLITTPGASITINGQHVHQSDNTHQIEQEFMMYYDVEIKDIETGKIDTSIMCWFRVWDNKTLIQDVEINFYPEEFTFFENFYKKIFG